MKGMIFAAGLGTRLKPFTLHHPKAMAPINGQPVLQKNIAYLKAFGINELVINVHHFADQIIDFLAANDNFGCSIHISDETDELLETGGGLLKARAFLSDSDFVVMNADILTTLNLGELIEQHRRNQALATLAVSERTSSRKLYFDTDMQLCGWKNFSTGEEITTHLQRSYELAFSGIHVLSPSIFEHITETGKFSIMKTYMRLMSQNKLMGYDHSGSVLIDIGKPENLEKAQTLFG